MISWLTAPIGTLSSRHRKSSYKSSFFIFRSEGAYDVLWKIHSRFISETQVRALNALDKRMPRKKAGRLVVSRSFGAKETFMRSLDKVVVPSAAVRC